MKLTSYPVAGFGALRVFATVPSCLRASVSARRRVRPGPVSDGWPFASLRVPCDARLAGPVAELAAFAALSTLRHLQRVSSRSALRARPATLCFSAAPIRPAQAAPAALPAAWRVFDESPATTAAATGRPGSAQRACEAPSRTGFGARARSALPDLTRCRCLSAVSAANAASSATGPGARASQGTRSAAKGQPSEPGPGRARRLARAEAGVRQRTHANTRNGLKRASGYEVRFILAHWESAWPRGSPRPFAAGPAATGWHR